MSAELYVVEADVREEKVDCRSTLQVGIDAEAREAAPLREGGRRWRHGMGGIVTVSA